MYQIRSQEHTNILFKGDWIVDLKRCVVAGCAGAHL